MFVVQREREGRPVGCFRVDLIEIHVHPVDSKETAFMRAAYLAMTRVFEAHEQVIDVCAEAKDET